MATVKVASERAVVGDLPAVCVRSGAPADAYVTIVTKVRGASPWTLALVFFGPFAWLVLIGLALSRGENFAVRVPFSAAAWDAVRRIGVAGYVMLAAGLAGTVTSVLLDPARLTTRYAVAVGLLGEVVVLAARAMLPRVGLDASGRTATIRHVHPRFRDAVLAESASDRADS